MAQSCMRLAEIASPRQDPRGLHPSFSGKPLNIIGAMTKTDDIDAPLRANLRQADSVPSAQNQPHFSAKGQRA